ncbi:MAG: hypothetical protein K6G86_04455 [Bacteroidales bacterium]|nr:hypothetical protein [Bacteroidales bacterium]
MTRPLLYTLTSGLHGEMAPDACQEPFIRGIEAALGMSFDCRDDDFSGYGAGDAPEIIYVRTGGTEGLFLEKVAPRLRRPVRLLTSGQSNSLAASMEILSWLRQHGFAGEILHGSAADIAARIRALPDGPVSSPAPSPGATSSPDSTPASFPGAEEGHFAPGGTENCLPGVEEGRFAPDGAENRFPGAEEGHFAPGGTENRFPGAEEGHFAPGGTENRFPGAEEGHFAPGGAENYFPGVEPVGPETFGRILDGMRFGVIGKPSDWLISSNVDYAVVRENLGVELVDIPIEELIEEARRPGPETTPNPGNPRRNGEGSPEKATVPRPGIDLKPLNPPRYGSKIDAGDWQGALGIYAALRRLVDRYHLDGLTLRCFDLLTALHNTGCLALAILNAEGVTATCEGDIPAMLSMAVARALTGRASFQVNLSRIEGDRLLFAHCTVPLSLVRDYCYDTHFESGIGVAIHGELPEGPVTLFKLSPDCRRMYRREARLVANTYGDALCRTQVVVEAPGAAAYFLRTPIGNHHILVPGKL